MKSRTALCQRITWIGESVRFKETGMYKLIRRASVVVQNCMRILQRCKINQGELRAQGFASDKNELQRDLNPRWLQLYMSMVWQKAWCIARTMLNSKRIVEKWLE